MSDLTPLQQGCLDTYAAACDLIPPHLRRNFILIGGVATIAHGASKRRTEDVDIAACQEAMVLLSEAANNRLGGFRSDATDESIIRDVEVLGGSSFQVTIEVLDLPGPFIPFIPSVERFRNGFVPTLPELVRLRADTLVNRGSNANYKDLKLILEMSMSRGLVLPNVEDDELGVLLEAVGMLEENDFGGYLISILNTETLSRYGISRLPNIA